MKSPHENAAQRALRVSTRTPRIRRAAVAVAGMTAVLVGGSVAIAAGAAPHAMHMAGTASSTHATVKHPKVSALRFATGRFHNLQVAENNGYALFTDAQGIACISMPHMGGMGVHFVNGSLVGDPAERVRHPEALVYRIDRTGMLRLAAVEYVVLADAWNAKHHNPPRLFNHKFMFTGAGNRYGLPPFYSLHAWVWHHNPAGNFAMWNPTVRC
jgi:hypothetical protein